MNDWRMDAMAEFFNAEFVRIGEDGEPVNDTTRDELVERITELVHAVKGGNFGMEWTRWNSQNQAEHIIVLVRADERRRAWQEFEAAMLSDKSLRAAAGAIDLNQDLAIEWVPVIRDAVSTALATIAPEGDSDTTQTECAALQKAITEIREATEYIDREVAPVGTLIKTSTTLLACPADMSQIRRNLDVIDRLLNTRAVPEPDADAVERAAKAIQACHKPMLEVIPPWDEEDDVWKDTYRDFARAALQAAAHGDDAARKEATDAN